MVNTGMNLVLIPSLDDDSKSFQWMFMTLENAISSKEEIQFDFSFCTHLSPSAVAFLGGMARIAQHNNIAVTFNWATLRNSNLTRELRQNGFAVNFGHTAHGWNSDSIPYREDPQNNPNSILDYLTDCWIGREWMKVSERLRDAIVGRVWEIYANSFEHGQSPVGVFTCGAHCSKKNEVVLSVIDFGTGIPETVRAHFKGTPRLEEILSSSLMEWAFKRGNTTGGGKVARGLGLDLLNEFVQLNQGSLEIYSNDGYARVDNKGPSFLTIENGFSGTVVQIKFKCDEKYYRFSDEALP